MYAPEFKDFLKVVLGVLLGTLLVLFGTPLVAHLVAAWDKWLNRTLG